MKDNVKKKQKQENKLDLGMSLIPKMQAWKIMSSLRWRPFGCTLASSSHKAGIRSNRGFTVSIWKKHRLLRRSLKTREKFLLNICSDRIVCSGTNVFSSIHTVTRVMKFMVGTGL